MMLHNEVENLGINTRFSNAQAFSLTIFPVFLEWKTPFALSFITTAQSIKYTHRKLPAIAVLFLHTKHNLDTRCDNMEINTSRFLWFFLCTYWFLQIFFSPG